MARSVVITLVDTKIGSVYLLMVLTAKAQRWKVGTLNWEVVLAMANALWDPQEGELNL